MNDFYVYYHVRKTDGSVFYVGKGKGQRFKSKSGRSAHWRNIVKKHGYEIKIVKSGLSESEAYQLEIDEISKLRSQSENICNIANGGNGGMSGINLTKDHKDKLRKAKLGKKQMPEHAAKSASAKIGKKQPKSAVDYVAGLKKKKVINSDGEVFESASSAARVISERLGVKASQGNISMVCRGERLEAYGLNWSYDLSETPKLRKRIVQCSNGMLFESVVDAAKWVESWRGKSVPSNITNSIFSNKKAYGFSWSYNEDTQP